MNSDFSQLIIFDVQEQLTKFLSRKVLGNIKY